MDPAIIIFDSRAVAATEPAAIAVAPTASTAILPASTEQAAKWQD